MVVNVVITDEQDGDPKQVIVSEKSGGNSQLYSGES